MKTTIRLIAVLAAVFTMTACVPDTDLAGYAWTYDNIITYDNDPARYECVLVCTSSSSGMLFIGLTYEDEARGICFAMPFTYTWDDNEGTATATLEFPDEWKGKAKGTYTFSFNMYYTKTEGLVVSSRDIEHLFELPCTGLNMVKKDHAKPAAMTGTRWVMEFEEIVDIPEGGVDTNHYHYELDFVNQTGAVLNLSMTDVYDEVENMRWNVNYTYSEGVGRTSIYFDGENIKGGFYMPDDTHMTFTDGENWLNFVKQ